MQQWLVGLGGSTCSKRYRWKATGRHELVYGGRGDAADCGLPKDHRHQVERGGLARQEAYLGNAPANFGAAMDWLKAHFPKLHPAWLSTR